MDPQHVQKNYEADGLTIHWHAEKCIHSAHCVKSNMEVFNPRRRPWVEPMAASGEEIAKIIDGCPSKALTYTKK